MIELLLGKINKISNRLTDILTKVDVDTYGNGSGGKVFYGINANNVPTGYDQAYIGKDSYQIPLNQNNQYDSLYIDEDTLLYSLGDYRTIYVKNDLYLYGTLSISGSHSGAYSQTEYTPNTIERIRSAGEYDLLLKKPFFITGGSGNPVFGGNSNSSGGCVIVYYANLFDANGNTRGTNWGNTINVLGSPSGNSGGCLLIAARNIHIGNNGHINSCGGGADTTGTQTSNSGIYFTYRRDGTKA